MNLKCLLVAAALTAPVAHASEFLSYPGVGGSNAFGDETVYRSGFSNDFKVVDIKVRAQGDKVEWLFTNHLGKDITCLGLSPREYRDRHYTKIYAEKECMFSLGAGKSYSLTEVALYSDGVKVDSAFLDTVYFKIQGGAEKYTVSLDLSDLFNSPIKFK